MISPDMVASQPGCGGQMGESVGPAGIHHVALVVNDADAAFVFYRDVLGLTPLDRPEGARDPGSWFELGDKQLHRFQPSNPAMSPPHFAVEVENLAATIADIRSHGVTVYETEHRPGFGYQASVLDPSGNLIELNQPDGRQA